MSPPPRMMFHSQKGYYWREDPNGALQDLESSLNNAPGGLPQSVAITVTQPDALATWLESHDAAVISVLDVFVNATSDAPSPQRWCLLFDKLRREATDIQDLSVYWDAEGPIHIGLGKSVVFIRGFAQLRAKRSLEIGGFYATHWPRYMEEMMGLKPVDKNIYPGSSWINILRKYQRGTESRNPWVDTQDGEWDLPRDMDYSALLKTLETAFSASLRA